MIADEINDLWDARPFCPFEIAMANGETYTVTSPKLILLSPSRLTLVTPDDRLHILALNQINRVTVMEGENPAATAGMERK